MNDLLRKFHDEPFFRSKAAVPRRLRVAIITSYAASASNFRGPLISDLVSKGCYVKVYAPDHSLVSRVELRQLGAFAEDCQMSRSGISPISDLRSLLSVWMSLVQFRPDVVLTYFVKPNIWGILAAAFAQVPRRIAMVEGMGYAFTSNELDAKAFKKYAIRLVILTLYRISFLMAYRVIVLNPDDLRYLVDASVVNSCKLFLLGGIGVPLDKWKVMPPFSQPITFTMVARLLREKGVFDFLLAAEAIKQKYPKTRFLLLGDLDNSPGSIQAADLEPWISRGIVDWLGHVDVATYLRVSSVFVLPSYYREGVPRSTQEAMASGRPIVTTDVPGCRETVVEGVNGFLVPPRNPEVLAQAMERFLRQPDLIEDMGRKSRLLAEELFDAYKASAKLMGVMGI